MSAAVAFTRATISALSASVRVTGPPADLMYSVLPSTLSIVPATRWVCCCAHAVETANTAAKAAAAIIRIVLISDLPKGDMQAEHTPVSPDGEAGAEGASGCVRLDLSASRRLNVAASGQLLRHTESCRRYCERLTLRTTGSHTASSFSR